MESKSSKGEPHDWASQVAFHSNNPFEPPPDDETWATQGDTRPIPDRGYGLIGKYSNMDPFEVRIRFTQHLQHLNASVTSANKAAQYALKYKDMDEDLHSCILEQLECVCLVDRPFLLHLYLLRVAVTNLLCNTELDE
jgi:hypothetical protein